MLRFVRRVRAFSIATLFVFATSVPASLTALMHADDDLCQPPLVIHDESAHRIGTARVAAPDAQHCAVCHWLQTLKTATAATVRVELVTEFQHVTSRTTHVSSQASAVDVPARAPPSFAF